MVSSSDIYFTTNLQNLIQLNYSTLSFDRHQIAVQASRHHERGVQGHESAGLPVEGDQTFS